MKKKAKAPKRKPKAPKPPRQPKYPREPRAPRAPRPPPDYAARPLRLSCTPLQVVTQKVSGYDSLKQIHRGRVKWLKDVGGKTTFLCTRVRVVGQNADVHEHLPAGVEVPLHATLCHEAKDPRSLPRPLSKKEATRATRAHLRKGQTALTRGATVLRIGPAPGEMGSNAQAFMPSLSLGTPEALVQFRIEDVSSNHTSNAFVLRVGVAPRTPYADRVAPCYTQQIAVLSKLRQTKKRAMYARQDFAEPLSHI